MFVVAQRIVNSRQQQPCLLHLNVPLVSALTKEAADVITGRLHWLSNCGDQTNLRALLLIQHLQWGVYVWIGLVVMGLMGAL